MRKAMFAVGERCTRGMANYADDYLTLPTQTMVSERSNDNQSGKMCSDNTTLSQLSQAQA